MTTSAPNFGGLFGRKYSLKVLTPPSQGSQTIITLADSSSETIGALRVTFDVQTLAWRDLWFAQICIYNLNETTTAALLSAGGNQQGVVSGTQVAQNMEVILEAGYQNGKYGVIWDGYVLQPLFERENQTDFKVTLNCVLGLLSIGRNFVGKTYTKEIANQRQVVLNIMRDSFTPISQGAISNNLPTKNFPRAKTVFGSPRKYLSEISRDQNMSWWLGQKGLLNIGKADEDLQTTSANPVVYTPTTGIVGTPQATQNGINVRLLLDPTVQVQKPMMCINLQNTQIRQVLQQVGVLPGFLSQDGTYVVIGVRYLGDTRGQDWYADVTGCLLAKEKLAAIQAGLQVQQWTP